MQGVLHEFPGAGCMNVFKMQVVSKRLQRVASDREYIGVAKSSDLIAGRIENGNIGPSAAKPSFGMLCFRLDAGQKYNEYNRKKGLDSERFPEIKTLFFC